MYYAVSFNNPRLIWCISIAWILVKAHLQQNLESGLQVVVTAWTLALMAHSGTLGTPHEPC